MIEMKMYEVSFDTLHRKDRGQPYHAHIWFVEADNAKQAKARFLEEYWEDDPDHILRRHPFHIKAHAPKEPPLYFQHIVGQE